MIKQSARSGIAATGACLVLLAGCDAVKDVRDEPFTATPQPKAVLKGTVYGVGSARAVELRYNGAPGCRVPDPANPAILVPGECRFFGVSGQESASFSFGSLDVGTPYTITVQSEPFGKNCVVANAAGTVGSGVDPEVTCTDDPAVPRYNLTVNLAPAVQALPNLRIGLVTEEDDLALDATGMASVMFPAVLFNSGINLPLFRYKLTATTESVAGGVTTTNLCTFTQTSGLSIGGQNVDSAALEAVVVPTGPVSVTVNACEFTPTASVQYSGTPAQAMPGTGMQLALRNHLTGVDEQTLEVAAFTAGAATVAFGTPLKAHARSMYELVVTRQPTGMHCIVAGTTTTVADTTSAVAGTAAAITAPTASAVLLVDPATTDWWAYAGRTVRCRAVPAPANRLRGTYQMDARVGTQPDTSPPRPYGRAREFLTFFEDGTFLYGINANSASYTAGHPNETFTATSSVRNNWAASSGVTHGFYAYNPGTQQITFTVFTATNINSASRGIHGMPGFAGSATAGGSVTATNVQKGMSGDLGTFAMTFSATSGTPPVTTTRRWTMTEPRHVAGELTGVWVTADHRRMFTYDGGPAYAFHIGVNALGNLQDGCMLPTDDSNQSGGVMTKHAGSATNDSFVFTCTPGIWNIGAALALARNLDLPHYAARNSTPSALGIGPTTPRIPPGLIARFPGTASQLDNRPTSPVTFQVTPGAVDTLVVRNTLNGTPIDYPVNFERQRTN